MRTYWLNLFTGKTWREFLDAGGKVTGFREHRYAQLRKMVPGDLLLCYLTGVSRWVGLLEVTGSPFKDSSPIWTDEEFPARIPVNPLIVLTPETAVPIHEMKNELSLFREAKNPAKWQGKLRGSPTRWTAADGEAVVAALRDAESRPVVRDVDPRKLAHRPRAYRAKQLGAVTVPEADPGRHLGVAEESSIDATPHTEIQWLLLKLGADLNLDLWVARNDRGREYRGHAFSELPRMKPQLPLQFDDATNRTIELIDVLWLQGNAIVAAFEIESTTSIYSGLLRMSDLVAMQPNINIPLYLVAPDERRNKVFEEVNRPTFSRLSPPLVDVCKYIPFSALRQQVEKIKGFVRYMRPDFLDEIAETCDV